MHRYLTAETGVFQNKSRLRFAGGWGLLRVYELLDFGAFFFDFGQVLGAKFLVNRKFLLCVFLAANVHIIRTQAIVGIGKVLIKLQGADVLRDRFFVLVLVGIK